MTNSIIRFLDIVISVIFLIFFFPLLILISVVIFMSDGMPILFKQNRIGYNGKIFVIYKFRTMRNIVLKDEFLRLTFFGKFLRKTSLDELPQFLNVLKKEMSIVGPRPLPVDIEKKISRSLKIKRRKILPGITGLSQVNYTGKKRKLRDKIDLDLKLIDNYGLYNYLIILFKTPFVIIIRFLRNKSSIIK